MKMASQLVPDRLARGVVVEGEHEQRETTDGQVDVETPTPGGVLGEGATDDGADGVGDHEGETHDGGDDTSVAGLDERGGDDEHEGLDTTATDTGNHTAADQHAHGVRERDDQRPDFEDDDGRDEIGLEPEQRRQPAPEQREQRAGKRVPGDQPPDVGVVVKFASDCVVKRHDDDNVERGEKKRQRERRHTQDEFQLDHGERSGKKRE